MRAGLIDDSNRPPCRRYATSVARVNRGVECNMDMRGGAALNLHDAVLERIEIAWEEKLCKCFIRAWLEGASGSACIEFFEVSDVSIPHGDPWGPSSSVLEADFAAGHCAITMQSGDVIRISAKGYRMVVL